MKKTIDYYTEMHVDGSGRVVLMREDSDDSVQEVAIVHPTEYLSVTSLDVQAAIAEDVLDNCIRVDYRQTPDVDKGDNMTTRYETPQYTQGRRWIDGWPAEGVQIYKDAQKRKKEQDEAATTTRCNAAWHEGQSRRTPMQHVDDMENSFKEEVNVFLDELRESGITNMFAADKYIITEFFVTKNKARELLCSWMKNFGDREREIDEREKDLDEQQRRDEKNGLYPEKEDIAN